MIDRTKQISDIDLVFGELLGRREVWQRLRSVQTDNLSCELPQEDIVDIEDGKRFCE